MMLNFKRPLLVIQRTNSPRYNLRKGSVTLTIEMVIQTKVFIESETQGYFESDDVPYT